MLTIWAAANRLGRLAELFQRRCAPRHNRISVWEKRVTRSQLERTTLFLATKTPPGAIAKGMIGMFRWAGGDAAAVKGAHPQSSAAASIS